MKKKDIEKLMVANESKLNERCRCLKAVDDEPEFPGDMPDKVAKAVSLTKQGIRDRILAGS